MVFQPPFTFALKRRPDAPFFRAGIRETQQTCATTTSCSNNDSLPTVVAFVDLAKLKAHRSYQRAPASLPRCRFGTAVQSRTIRNFAYPRSASAYHPHAEDRVHPVMPTFAAGHALPKVGDGRA